MADSITTILGNLNQEIAKIKNKTYSGILKASLLVQRRAQQKTPVDTGILKASAYTNVDKATLTGEVGFSTKYAVHVHENLEAHHPVGEAKFLERAVMESTKDILSIISAEAKI